LRKRKKTIGRKWVYTKILGSFKEDIVRYKIRLAAKGDARREGIVYNEVFSPYCIALVNSNFAGTGSTIGVGP